MFSLREAGTLPTTREPAGARAANRGRRPGERRGRKAAGAGWEVTLLRRDPESVGGGIPPGRIAQTLPGKTPPRTNMQRSPKTAAATSAAVSKKREIRNVFDLPQNTGKRFCLLCRRAPTAAATGGTFGAPVPSCPRILTAPARMPPGPFWTLNSGLTIVLRVSKLLCLMCAEAPALLGQRAHRSPKRGESEGSVREGQR